MRLGLVAISVGLLILTAADLPPPPSDAPAQPATTGAPITREEVSDAFVAAQKALTVANLKLEMLKRSGAAVGVAPVVNVAAPPETGSGAVLRQIRDAAVPVFMAGLLAFLGVVAKNLPAATDALDKWIQLRLTTHQQGRVYAAVQTAAGQIETKIDRGAMAVSEVTEDSPKVRAIVRNALLPVQESAEAQGATVDSLAPVVVGRVDTKGARKASAPVVNVTPSAVVESR